MNSNKRHQLFQQIADAQNMLKYSKNLSDEQKATLQMRINSAQRQLDSESNGSDIFHNDIEKLGSKPTGNVDIFNPEPNEVSDETKDWLFSGQDFGVPKPAKEYPHLTYYSLFQNGKKR